MFDAIGHGHRVMHEGVAYERKLEKLVDIVVQHFVEGTCFSCPVTDCRRVGHWGMPSEECRGTIRAWLEKESEVDLDA